MDKKSNLLTPFFFPENILQEISNEERRKRVYIFAVAIVTTFILFGYGIIHLYYEGFQRSWPDLLASGLLFIMIIILRIARDSKAAFRVGMMGMTILLLYNIYLGLYNGGDIVWFYMYPLVVFFIFGIYEGFIWNFLTMGMVFFFIFFPDLTSTYNFSPEFKFRLMISLVMISFMAGLLESLRNKFYTQLQEKNSALETAMDNIRKLQGLLPICSNCKKIRDDNGYWHQVEAYISKNSDAEFTHGICPKCEKKLYPGLSLNHP